MLPILSEGADSSFSKDPYFDAHPSRCDASQYKIVTAGEAAQLFAGRDVYIWGAGQKGRGFYLAMQRCGFQIKRFLDTSADVIGSDFLGVRISHPDEVLRIPNASERVFVLTASVDAKNKEMFRVLEHEYNLVKGTSFDSIQSLSPLYPTIEVTGLCNLRCSSCPRGDETLLPTGKYMSFENYEKIIRKLVKEIPFLYLVDLYVWGEPMLNPELPEIIRLNNSLGIASGLSTNLNSIRHLERVMEAFPAQLRVSLSGMSKETYEITHTGGKWDAVKKNLEKLAEVNDRLGRRTIIELYFHIYKHNVSELQAAVELCQRYGFRLHPSLAILFHDLVLRYAQTGEVHAKAKDANERLVIGLDELLRDCELQADRNCILTRIVPVINWDMSVMACCTYTYSDIAKSYLDVSLDEVIARRTYSHTCGVCQSHALHRWNDQGKYAPLVADIMRTHTTT